MPPFINQEPRGPARTVRAGPRGMSRLLSGGKYF